LIDHIAALSVEHKEEERERRKCPYINKSKMQSACETEMFLGTQKNRKKTEKLQTILLFGLWLITAMSVKMALS